MHHHKLFVLLAAAIAGAFSACSQIVTPSEEDIELAEELQNLLEPSSSSKAKSSPAAKVSSSSNIHSSSSGSEGSPAAKVSSSSSSRASGAIIMAKDAIIEANSYTTRDSVAAYLCKFDKLPENYVGKNEGKKLYEAQGNTFSKWNFNPWTTLGAMIGGDDFDNFADDPNPDYYHPTLPEGKYHEADVDYSAANRGTKRLVYQADCVIYYTADHYENFGKLELEWK